MKLHNADTIHSEIVALCDLKELLAHAKAEGEIEFAGLVEYEAQQSVQRIGGTRSIFFNPTIGAETPDPFEQDDTANR